MISFYALWILFSVLVNCHVIKIQDISFTEAHIWYAFQLAYFILGTTTKLAIGLWLGTLESNIQFVLTVTESNIKK